MYDASYNTYNKFANRPVYDWKEIHKIIYIENMDVSKMGPKPYPLPLKRCELSLEKVEN